MSTLGEFAFLGKPPSEPAEKPVGDVPTKVKHAMKRIVEMRQSDKLSDRIKGMVAVRAMARSRKTAQATRASLKARVK